MYPCTQTDIADVQPIPEDLPKQYLHQTALESLGKYAASKDSEKYAVSLMKYYRAKRQSEYRNFLKKYDELVKHPDFSATERRYFQDSLEFIHKSFHSL